MLKYDITPIKSKNSFKENESLTILVVITSLQSSAFEYANSMQALSILQGLNLKYLCKDINQEMVLSYQEKIKTGIRQKYRDDGIIYLINKKMSLPQIHIGDSLVLNFTQFKALQESSLLVPIVNKLNCQHVRFYKDSIEYVKTSEDSETCIYCYSEKRVNVKFTFLLNKRDSYDEEVHIVSSICEENRISLKILDIDNLEAEMKFVEAPLSFIGKSCMMFKFNNLDYYGFDRFAEIIENKMIHIKESALNKKCEICDELLDPCLYDIKKCLTCIYVYSSGKSAMNSSRKIEVESKEFDETSPKKTQVGEVYSDITDRRSKFVSFYDTENKENLRPINFIEKLDLKKISHVRKLDFNEKGINNSGVRLNQVNSKSDTKATRPFQLINQTNNALILSSLKADSFLKIKDLNYNESNFKLGKHNNPLFQSFGNRQLD